MDSDDSDDRIFREQLGLEYGTATVAYTEGPPAGAGYTQKAPSMPQDRVDSETAWITLINGWARHDNRQVPRLPGTPRGTHSFQVLHHEGRVEITNGQRRVDLPESQVTEGTVPGPLLDWRLGYDRAPGCGSRLHGFQGAEITTTIESIGVIMIQWRVEYRRPDGGWYRQRGRWLHGEDTIEIVDEAALPEGAMANWQWSPFGSQRSRVYVGGAGEGDSPMVACRPADDDAESGRPLAVIGHCSYHNQWRQGWATFLPDPSGTESPTLSIFGGWASLWRRRGHQGMVVRSAGERSWIESPITSGRRLYGLVLADFSESGISEPMPPSMSKLRRHGRDAEPPVHTAYCTVAKRKRQHADLPLAKTATWQLDVAASDAPTALRLVPADWLATLADRVMGDPLVAGRLGNLQHPNVDIRAATAVALGDREAARAVVPELLAVARGYFERAAAGGYEGVIIFQGRSGKALAYSASVLRAAGYMTAAEFAEIARGLALLAYVFSDPDYCRYGDFWAGDEPDEGVVEALAPEMGDCPVPPNFASEYFSTVGLVAELLPAHPMAAEWRAWACAQCDRFLEVYFAADGTYHESINYHSHGVLELVTWFQALRHNGGRDYFQHPAIVGSYRHFTELAMPPLVEGLPDPGVAADPELLPRVCYPANGNSGKDGTHQPVRPDILVAATVYRDSHPELAGALMRLWRLAGRPLLEAYAPMLTLLAWQPDIPEAPLPDHSVHRQGLGVVSRCQRADGVPVWALFRAGAATHHMDFDQGHLQLTLADRELLGDHGYHTHDTDGSGIHAASTWLHSTVTYGETPSLSSGYTGLEVAPEPLCVHLGEEFDWCLHRIENSNYRELTRLAYNVLVPCATTVHLRRYLCLTSGVIVIWDSFESTDAAPVWRLTPRHAVSPLGAGEFRAGRADEPHLHIRLLAPTAPEVLENRAVGPLHSLALRAPNPGDDFLAVLTPTMPGDPPTVATWDVATRRLTIAGQALQLPAADTPHGLPRAR